MHELNPSAEIIAMEKLFDRLWPINRSITGDGVRQTHDILGELIPLTRIEVPSGSHIFDWIVPPEWELNEAYIIDPNGRQILDVQENNLHLISYSEPYRGTLSKSELEKHLHSLPDLPDAIPYLTSYYNRTWGFCLSQKERDSLPEGNYEIVVDTKLKANGSMTISEVVLPGETEDEVLISTYTCHPSMANNELSGPLVATFLYQRLAAMKNRRFTYRFAFLVETIGAIAYLHQKGEHLRHRLKAGLVTTCVGLDVPFTYKRSLRGNTLIDRIVGHVLKEENVDHKIIDFFPWGSDERQYCSPGFDLPVGSLMRGSYLDFPEYHTSLDNRDLISFTAISESVDIYLATCMALERNIIYRNLVANGEPQLGKYNLYPKIGSLRQVETERQELLWFLSLADGHRDLLEIASTSGVSIERLEAAARKCLEAQIVEIVH
jgi:aminopeptidase-like protein